MPRQRDRLQPLDQTFLLHSKPGAAHTIYLNFKGGTLRGPATVLGGTASGGSFNFTVTGVSKSGYSYLPASNTETSDSIAR